MNPTHPPGGGGGGGGVPQGQEERLVYQEVKELYISILSNCVIAKYVV